MANWLGDAGHGGKDAGASYNGRKESDDVLRLAARVGELMRVNGENFAMTRTSDKFLELSERTAIENRGNYDYFISFHRNAFNPNKAKGVETYSLSTTGKGRELAAKVQGNLNKIFFDRGVKTSNFYVLRKTNCSAILIEVGFVDNDEDNKIFDQKFEEIAQAIAKACLSQVGKQLALPQNKPQASTEKKGLYRVIAGSYQDKQNAINMQELLKSKGIPSFLEYKE